MADDTSLVTATGGPSHMDMAKPLGVQKLEQALRIEPLLGYVEKIVADCNNSDLDTDTDVELDQKGVIDGDGTRTYNGISTTRLQRRVDKNRLYNFSKARKSRRWLKTILLSDSSSSDDDDQKPVTESDLKHMIKQHKYHKRCRQEFRSDPELQQYQYYSVGLLSNFDKFYEHQKQILGPKRALCREQKREKKHKAKLDEDKSDVGLIHLTKSGKVRKLTQEQITQKRRKLWVALVKKDVPKACKQQIQNQRANMVLLRKVAKESTRESRRAAIQSQKISRETPARARRLSREMCAYWKRFEKVEKEHRRKAEKEAQEQRKMDVGLREMKRQQRKLNFLITQTELYAHFMSRKRQTGESDDGGNKILEKLEETSTSKPKQPRSVTGGTLTDMMGENYDSDQVKSLVLNNVESAIDAQRAKTSQFDHVTTKPAGSFANPTISTDALKPQPGIFEGQLKGYQLKGMNWLANLYNQGINGILADEMGLGKTVQSIAFLAHLAEEMSIWGPFLIVSPSSTLHNWQQELTKFMPAFKVVPYWGNTQDRKVLRKFWNQDNLHSSSASFHVVVTSYQLVIQDVKYFQRIKWHYMILDEAQAIKSASSVRWKILLGFNCRNRMLLTGTPIQNSMAELWALLHFIMPTLFDSHDEFNEWFSKDIETHAERQSGIDEDQLSRLHMILKPFMLRRCKTEVENELSDKIEVLMYCPMTKRQQLLYQAVKGKISIEELLQSAAHGGNITQVSSTSSLMNLVMQFRKVCNHPELLEKREIRTGFHVRLDPYHIPKLIYRDGILRTCFPSQQHILYSMFYIHHPANVQQSLKPSYCHKHNALVARSCFSFLRFINLSSGELFEIMSAGMIKRWLALFVCWKEAFRIHHNSEWQDSEIHTRLPNTGFLLSPLCTTHFTNVTSSPFLDTLLFTSHSSSIYTHTTHTYHCTRETMSHRMIRFRNHMESTGSLNTLTAQKARAKISTAANSVNTIVKPKSPTKGSHSPEKLTLEQQFELFPTHPHKAHEDQVFELQCTDMPPFLYHNYPKIKACPYDCYTSDRSAEWQRVLLNQCGSYDAYQSFLYGTSYIAELCKYQRLYFSPERPMGLLGIQPKYGYSGVFMPGKETLISDAGKLFVLDTLLARLKAEGHRVLIYSQMTRMIDILEEYMWHRRHTFMRLDGSSKISDRRDMVEDFQTRSDIFVFLLSTRAGGLGINLTAADTVIFYDSDWNPTVDQQAMDRAHRLGQTKQVTVYRLITKGTIEEKILQRAKEKSEIQRVVMSGGAFKPDVLKPKEVVSLLLDDDNLEEKYFKKETEKKNKQEDIKEKQRKRKKADYAKKKVGTVARKPGRPKTKKESASEEQASNLTIAEGLEPSSSPHATTQLPGAYMSAAQPAGSHGTPTQLPGGVTVNGMESRTYAVNDSLTSSPASVSGDLWNNQFTLGDDSSNDGLVIVDDSIPQNTSGSTPVSTPNSTPPARGKRGSGRSRGRPKGSTSSIGRRPRGRSSLKKALSAAEIAGAQAGKSAGYSAYGYSFTGNHTPGMSPSGSPRGGGGHTPVPSPRGGHTPTPSRGASPGHQAAT